ncbi:hypothetical protein CsatB_014328 [Cannabis sativa]
MVAELLTVTVNPAGDSIVKGPNIAANSPLMNYLNDTVIKSIRSVDSKQFHFAIIGAVNLKEKRLVVSVKGAKEAICLIENF